MSEDLFSDDPRAEELRALGPVTHEQRIVGVLFGVVAVLWVFRSDLNLGSFIVPGWNRLHPALKALDDGAVALLVALLLFFIPAKDM